MRGHQVDPPSETLFPLFDNIFTRRGLCFSELRVLTDLGRQSIDFGWLPLDKINLK